MQRTIECGRVVWLTGLSGSGKSTLSQLVREALRAGSIPAVQLDGDDVRHGMNRDLGFSQEDRSENLRRCAELSKLLCEQGLVVIASFITPLESQRLMVREIVGATFRQVYVKCSVETAVGRDPKELYKNAASGEIPNFTGISSAFDVPLHSELEVDTESSSAEECAAEILNLIYGSLGQL